MNWSSRWQYGVGFTTLYNVTENEPSIIVLSHVVYIYLFTNMDTFGVEWAILRFHWHASENIIFYHGRDKWQTQQRNAIRSRLSGVQCLLSTIPDISRTPRDSPQLSLMLVNTPCVPTRWRCSNPGYSPPPPTHTPNSLLLLIIRAANPLNCQSAVISSSTGLPQDKEEEEEEAHKNLCQNPQKDEGGQYRKKKKVNLWRIGSVASYRCLLDPCRLRSFDLM